MERLQRCKRGLLRAWTSMLTRPRCVLQERALAYGHHTCHTAAPPMCAAQASAAEGTMQAACVRRHAARSHAQQPCAICTQRCCAMQLCIITQHSGTCTSACPSLVVACAMLSRGSGPAPPRPPLPGSSPASSDALLLVVVCGPIAHAMHSYDSPSGHHKYVTNTRPQPATLHTRLCRGCCSRPAPIHL